MVQGDPQSSALTPPPPITQWLVDGFVWYSQRLMRRHFHSLAVDTRQLVWPGGEPPSEPVILFANHPGWWDPIIGMLLSRRFFSQHRLYAPIDAAALKRYQVLSKLGFYGIDLSSRQGAAQFLSTSNAILASPKGSIWLTPEGRFCDVRDHDAGLMPGLTHLVARHPNAWVVPFAIEYVFWEERLPEALVRFGSPHLAQRYSGVPKRALAVELEQLLRREQRGLAESSLRRTVGDFQTLFVTRPPGSIYDTLRSIVTRLRGGRFDPRHGTKFQP
jgi:1-acyl-sn-glycerol-3-phosphate acyltransferase